MGINKTKNTKSLNHEIEENKLTDNNGSFLVLGFIGHVTMLLYNILYYPIFLYKRNLGEINYFKRNQDNLCTDGWKLNNFKRVNILNLKHNIITLLLRVFFLAPFSFSM